MTDPGVLEVSVHVDAAPENVFPYFTDPTRNTQWMGSGATLDPVPGGTYRVAMRGGFEAAGMFLEIDPPRRVVFTWTGGGHPVPPGSTRVEVTLLAEDGGTRIVLRHFDLPTENQLHRHHTGWALYLDRLRVRVVGGDPGPDPNS